MKEKFLSKMVEQQQLEKFAYICLVVMAGLCAFSEAGSRNAVRVLLLVAAIGIALYPANIDRIKQYKLMIIGFISFFLVITMSAVVAGNLAEAIDHNSYWYSYTALIAFAIPMLLRSKQKMYIVFFALMASMLVSDIWIYWEWMQGTYRPDGPTHFVFNTASTYAVCVPVLLVLLLADKEIKYKWFIALSLLLGVLSLVFMNTRGAWFGAGVGCLSVVLLCYKSINRKYLAAFGIASVVLLGTVAVAIPHEAQRIVSLAEIADENKHPGGERHLLWEASVKMIKDYPLTGIGWGNFEEFYSQKYISPIARERSHSTAHNTLLQIGAENGIFAMIVYVAVNIYMLVFAWKRRKSIYGVMMFSMIMAFQAYGTTFYLLNMFESMRVFWLCLGLSLAGMQMDEL